MLQLCSEAKGITKGSASGACPQCLAKPERAASNQIEPAMQRPVM